MTFARNISRLLRNPLYSASLGNASLRHASTSGNGNVSPSTSAAPATDCVDRFSGPSCIAPAPVLTPEFLRGISSSGEKLTQSKALFSSLAGPGSIPAGEFRGDFVGLFVDSALIKLAVPALWEGVRFGGDNATILINSWLSWMLPKEVGTVSIAESVYDEGEALRVDFEDRFWESRKVNENQFLSIVTNKESGEVMDVHTLTRTGN